MGIQIGKPLMNLRHLLIRPPSYISDAKGLDKLNHISVDTVMNHMLRKTTKKNTWIFVADTSFRMYVRLMGETLSPLSDTSISLRHSLEMEDISWPCLLLLKSRNKLTLLPIDI